MMMIIVCKDMPKNTHFQLEQMEKKYSYKNVTHLHFT